MAQVVRPSAELWCLCCRAPAPMRASFRWFDPLERCQLTWFAFPTSDGRCRVYVEEHIGGPLTFAGSC